MKTIIIISVIIVLSYLVTVWCLAPETAPPRKFLFLKRRRLSFNLFLAVYIFYVIATALILLFIYT